MTIGYGNTLIANVDDVDADTYYYPATAGIEMAGYVVATVGFLLAGGATLTIEGCMRKVAHDGLTDTWKDITKSFTDLSTGLAAAASFADTSAILQCNGLCVDRIRVKVVTSDDSNSVDVWLRRM
jgi:hypothetical protein